MPQKRSLLSVTFANEVSIMAGANEMCHIISCINDLDIMVFALTLCIVVLS